MVIVTLIIIRIKIFFFTGKMKCFVVGYGVTALYDQFYYDSIYSSSGKHLCIMSDEFFN